jgi:hypothetical protein
VARFLALALLLSSVACSARGTLIHGYGMSLKVPPGWHGSITHGLVRLRGDGLRLWIRESSTPISPADPFFQRRTVPTLRASDFGSEQHLGFRLSGRRFAVLLPSPSRPSAAALDLANAALRSFTVKPGNYYGQRLSPARFPARLGWFVGAQGGKLYAEGGQTETWAATVPYRDAPLQIPPQRTLARLPDGGVIIWVSLSRDSALRIGPVNSLRIRPRLIGSSFEGLPPGIGLYRASVRKTGYDLDLWLFFKIVHPAPKVIARAQAELDRLRLPSWPAG